MELATWHLVLLIAGAGFLAGGANTIAGGGTLIAYPALLLAGMDPVAANATAAVGLSSGFLGGSFAYRRDLAQPITPLLPLATACGLGAAVGAILLAISPDDAFTSIVPYLVLASCALLAVQPRVSTWLAGLPQGRIGSPRAWTLAGLFVGGIYGGYFGPGSGVLLLFVLGVAFADTLQRLNAIKTLLALVTKVVSVPLLALFGIVEWPYAGLIFVTALVGGWAGGRVVRTLPAAPLRITIIGVGVVIGVLLFT